MKATNEHFRCDLCGRFSNFGVTETRPTQTEGMDAQSTVCVRCISNATALLLDGLIRVGETAAVEET